MSLYLASQKQQRISDIYYPRKPVQPRVCLTSRYIVHALQEEIGDMSRQTMLLYLHKKVHFPALTYLT